MLEFRNVHKDYAADASALRGLSFTVGAGELAALAGPSGSGKTTILNLAAGLDVASRGEVLFLGRDLARVPAAELPEIRRCEIGFVFQSYNLFPVLTALENVEFPLALKRMRARERTARARAALAEVGLADFAGRLPSQLSGGQQQRVAVARAMVAEPRIVLADEPTASLDARSAEGLLALFERLNAQTGTTFLLSSHDPRVLRAARRIIRIADGRLDA